MGLWLATQNALQTAIAAGAGTLIGSDSRRVIWKWQNANQPAVAYAALSLSGPSTVGQDSIVTDFDGTRPAGQEVRLSVLGLREVTLTVECYTSTVADDTDALSLAEQIRTSLLLPSIRDALAAVDVVPFDASGAIQYIPAIVTAKFRGRAVLPIRCWMPAPVVAEYTTYVSSLGITLTVNGADIPVVIP